MDSLQTFPPGTNASDILGSLQRLIDERDAAQTSLIFAMETIHELKAHVLELNSLLTEAQATIEASQVLSVEKLPDKPAKNITYFDSQWINDTWLCIPTADSLLSNVETHWRRGQGQYALNMIHGATKKDIPDADRLRLFLLKAAILCSYDKVQDSTEVIGEVINECKKQPTHTYSSFREISAIAHFIRGKILLSQKEWKFAFWAFSLAMTSRAYRNRAEELKSFAWEKLTEGKKGADDSAYGSCESSGVSMLSSGRSSSDGFEDISIECGLKRGSSA